MKEFRIIPSPKKEPPPISLPEPHEKEIPDWVRILRIRTTVATHPISHEDLTMPAISDVPTLEALKIMKKALLAQARTMIQTLRSFQLTEAELEQADFNRGALEPALIHGAQVFGAGIEIIIAHDRINDLSDQLK